MELMYLWLVFFLVAFVSVVFQVPQMIKASECIESGSLICPEENLISLIYLHSVPRMQTSTGERKSLYSIRCHFFLNCRHGFVLTASDMSWSKGLNTFSFISFLFVVVVVKCFTSRDILVFWLFSLPSVCLSVILCVMFSMGLLIFVSFSVCFFSI